MTFNVELAERVLGQIEAYPKTWLQGIWRCKTGMCFAGWAAELSGAQWTEGENSCHISRPDGTAVPVWTLARELLDIDQVSADALFCAFNTLDDLKRGVKYLANGEGITHRHDRTIGHCAIIPLDDSVHDRSKLYD